MDRGLPWFALGPSSEYPPSPARAQRRVRRVVTQPVTIPELCSVVDWPGEVDPRVKEEQWWVLGLACQPRSPTPRGKRLWNGRGLPRRQASAPWGPLAASSTRTTTFLSAPRGGRRRR